eukprot:Mrub_04186.p1 GENE.Mrub_04186~~Mrub_04186.p1  ORF type:complete len:427 (-),score=67.15 Mrub_04186:35-1294(-)
MDKMLLTNKSLKLKKQELLKEYNEKVKETKSNFYQSGALAYDPKNIEVKEETRKKNFGSKLYVPASDVYGSEKPYDRDQNFGRECGFTKSELYNFQNTTLNCTITKSKATSPTKMQIDKGQKYKFQVRMNQECCGDNDYYVFNDDKKVLKIDLPESDHYSVKGDKIWIKYPEKGKDDEVIWKNTGCYFKVKEFDEEIKQSVEKWDMPDSDSSDYSKDDWIIYGLLDGRIDYAEVQLKWKISCNVDIYFEDNKIGKVKLKAKGKCSCEVWKEWVQEKKLGADPKDPDSYEWKKKEMHNFDGRPKICKIKAYYGEDTKLDIDYQKNGWTETNWDRVWNHEDFKTTFTFKPFCPECEVDTNSTQKEPLVMLAYGFIIGFYYHPNLFDHRMKEKALVAARKYAKVKRRRRPSKSNSSDKSSRK